MAGTSSPVPVATAAGSTSAAISLKEVAKWDGKSQEIYKVLTAAFDAEDYPECIKDLRAREIEPLLYVDNLNKIIDGLSPADSEFKKRCVRALRKTCGLNAVLPTCYEVAFPLSKSAKEIPFTSGSFGDVWRLTHAEDHNLVFAVKSLRVDQRDSIKKIQKKYCKEVVVCKRVEHQNVLTIEGVAPKLFEFCMVSRWMENDNMLQYVAKNPDANRFTLLVGVTRGLEYLHSNNVVHGDLKGANIVIDQERSPRLTDFGLSSITKNIASVNASTPNRGCTVRYCAPELLDYPEDVKNKKSTNESDVYSLSMVIVEAPRDRGVPFSGLRDPVVMRLVSKGKRPPKPRDSNAPGMTPLVWEIAEKCWHKKAKLRPDVKAVLRRLENMEAETGDKRTTSTLTQWLRDTFSAFSK